MTAQEKLTKLEAEARAAFEAFAAAEEAFVVAQREAKKAMRAAEDFAVDCEETPELEVQVERVFKLTREMFEATQS